MHDCLYTWMHVCVFFAEKLPPHLGGVSPHYGRKDCSATACVVTSSLNHLPIIQFVENSGSVFRDGPVLSDPSPADSVLGTFVTKYGVQGGRFLVLVWYGQQLYTCNIYRNSKWCLHPALSDVMALA